MGTMDLFLVQMSKKRFMKTLMAWVRGGELSDFEVAKALSSMITHTLIELDNLSKGSVGSSPEVLTVAARELHLQDQMRMLSDFLGGRISNAELREVFREGFSGVIE